MSTIHVDPTLVVAVLYGLAGVAVWFAALGLALLVTRPADVRPLPPSQDLPGDEPPAIVSLLTNRWEITEDAAESTLIDLAARKLLEFRQPANDPWQTTVHVRSTGAQGLLPYESSILNRVSGMAVDGMVPLTALTFRDKGSADRFSASLTHSVIDDARTRGLSRRRFSPGLVSALGLAAGIPAFTVAGAIVMYLAHQHKLSGNWVGVIIAGIITWSVLGGLAGRNRGERDTPLGKEVAARWLGLRAWLRGDESFAELPPAAVAVWDRYLSYGDAVGATRICSAVIDLGMGNRKRVWSSFGGTWHRVRVRYPRFWRRYGQKAVPLFAKALAALVVSAVVYKGGSRLPVPSQATDYVGLGVTVVFLWPLFYGCYTLLGAIVDVAVPVTITGEVLWMETWKSKGGGEDNPPVPWLEHFALDDGKEDRTRAWGLPTPLSGGVSCGDIVTVTARRWTRRVITLQVVTPGRERAMAGAAAGDETTGDVLRGAMGGINGASAQALATALRPSDVSPVQLVTPDDVGRALGQPVAVRGQSRTAVGPMAIESYLQANGKRVLMVSVATGPTAQLAMRMRRRYQPLPGIGDEAFAGDDWAVGRRGSRVVMLQLHGAGRTMNPQNVYWLLATAVSRLPA
jgi:hypothetical protein